VTLVTYNVHFGKKTESLRDIFKHHPLLSKADIILFQEIEDRRIEGSARAERIARSLGYHCVYAPARLVGGKGTHGLATFSRFPIESFEITNLGFFKQLFRSRQRIALNTIIKVHGKRIQICNIHLDVRLNLPERIAQIAPVLQNLKKTPADGTVLAGDLNMTPLKWSRGGIPLFYANQRGRFETYLRTQGFALQSAHLGATMARGFLRFHLDGMATNDLTVLDSGIVDDVGVSDHRPLWLKFTP
jgi:endonuclease/exonuclease/phosphatase family metal-dependent hydrolase